MQFSWLISSVIFSALSLRLFGQDITAAREGGKKVPQTSQLPQNTGNAAVDEGAENDDEDLNLEDEGDDGTEQ